MSSSLTHNGVNRSIRVFVLLVVLVVVDVVVHITIRAGMTIFTVVVGDHIMFIDSVPVGDDSVPVYMVGVGVLYVLHFCCGLAKGAIGAVVVVNGAVASLVIWDYPSPILHFVTYVPWQLLILLRS